MRSVWAPPGSLAAITGILNLVSFPLGTEMFHFPRSTYLSILLNITSVRFPHSDTTGSKLVRQLPDLFRRHTTSFIAYKSQGILHTPLFRYSCTELWEPLIQFHTLQKCEMKPNRLAQTRCQDFVIIQSSSSDEVESTCALACTNSSCNWFMSYCSYIAVTEISLLFTLHSIHPSKLSERTRACIYYVKEHSFVWLLIHSLTSSI